MKIGPLIAFAGLCTTAISPAAFAVPVCIRTHDIADARSKDGKFMTFTMNDGTILRNRLRGICSDLRFNGFAWDIMGDDDQVCEGLQTLRVINSGQVCALGKFDPPEKPKPKP